MYKLFIQNAPIVMSPHPRCSTYVIAYRVILYLDKITDHCFELIKATLTISHFALKEMCHVPNTNAFNMLEELPFCESLGEGIIKVVQCWDFGDVNVCSVYNLTNEVILPLYVFSPLVASRLFGVCYRSTVVTVKRYRLIHICNNFQIA